MKIAICLSGHLRTYEKTYQSIYDQLLNKYDCDIFISTWKNLGNIKFAGGNDTEKSEFVDIETIKKIYNPISIVMDDAETESISNKLKKEYEGLKLGNGDKMSQLMIMMYKIWDVNRLKREYEEKNNLRYDVVIRGRFDVYFKPPKIETALNKIQATPGHMGVTDFVFAGPSSLMNDLCDIYTIMSPRISFSMFENIDKIWSVHLTNNNIPFQVSFDNFDYLRYAPAGIYDNKGNKVSDYTI